MVGRILPCATAGLQVRGSCCVRPVSTAAPEFDQGVDPMEMLRVSEASEGVQGRLENRCLHQVGRGAGAPSLLSPGTDSETSGTSVFGSGLSL